jgi:hypothetical protein
VSDDAVEVIRRMGIAFNARDYDAMGEFLDPEAEFFDHMPLPDVSEAAQGREEIAAVLDAWSRGFSGFEAAAERAPAQRRPESRSTSRPSREGRPLRRSSRSARR